MATLASPMLSEFTPAPSPTDVANDHSLLKLDYELDLLLEQIEDEIEESGEASEEAMDRLQLFCQAMNVKVDRIGRYLAVRRHARLTANRKPLVMLPVPREQRTRSPAPNPWSSTTWRAMISSKSRPMISPSVARRTRRTA